MKTTTLLLTMLAAALFSPSSNAATSGSVTIQGSVPSTVAITVVGAGTYNALDLTTNAADLEVATVTEVSNDALGYTVTLASTNAGKLKNGSLGSVSYTAKYNGTNVTLGTTAQTVTNAGSTSTLVNAAKGLTISYSGQAASSMMSGTYSDTLTFTIAAK